MATATYPYDPTGEAITNRITNELHNIQPPANVNDASFIIPRAAPFFLNSLKVKKGTTANAEVLLEGVHYIVTHHFVSLSYTLGTPFYSSITLMNRNYSGNVYLDYQTPGGQFVLDSYAGVEELTRQVYSIYSVTWEQVAGLIQGLAPYDHKMSGDDTTGYGEMVDAIKLIAATLRDKLNGGGGTESGVGARLDTHLNANSAHTKDQVGLNRVENYGIATTAEARSGTVGNKYITPLLMNVAIAYYLEQAGIANVPVTVQQLLTNYTNLASRLTGVNDNLNTTSGNLSNLASLVDGLTMELQDTRLQFNNNVNDANQQIDLLSREILNAAAEIETLGQNIFFNENEIVETNRKLGLVDTALSRTNQQLGTLTETVDSMSAVIAKLDPSQNPTAITYLTGGYRTFTIPAGCKAKVTLIGAVTMGNSDPDTRLFEGSRYDSTNNTYYTIAPNFNSPIANAPGGVSGTLTGRVPSHSLSNATSRTGAPATLQSSTAEGIVYGGGDGVVVNAVTYGTGITGSPTLASAGASSLEAIINNATKTPLIYHVYVGEGLQTTSLSGLARKFSGICVVELTKNT